MGDSHAEGADRDLNRPQANRTTLASRIDVEAVDEELAFSRRADVEVGRSQRQATPRAIGVPSLQWRIG
jgi:hypothetical protein